MKNLKLKAVKLTDKELDKLILILGTYKVKELFVYNEIQLNNKQLDYLINFTK